MKGFRLICAQCGSDKVLEKSQVSKLDLSDDKVIYGEGVQRKCINCSNESFEISKTWQEDRRFENPERRRNFVDQRGDV